MARYSVTRGSFDSLATCKLVDTATHIEAVVVPSVGSNMVALRWGQMGVRILHEPPSCRDLLEAPTAYGFPILMPPNRIESARFDVDGRSYEFPQNHGEHHIHGLVHSLEWDVARQCSSDREGAVVETVMDSLSHPEVKEVYSQHFRLTMRYVLKEGGVTVSCRCENLSDMQLPFGVGFHPYFRTPVTSASSKASCFVRLPAREQWVLRDCFPTGERVLPSGAFDLREFKPVSELRLDDLYGYVIDQTALLEDRDSGLRVAVEADDAYPFWVVWTGRTIDAPFICLEPYSCVTNAFNLDLSFPETGARLLDPGEVFFGSIKLTVEMIKREE